MDRTKFSDKSPGRCVPIPTLRGTDWAFIPHPMPPTWEIDDSIWQLLVEAKEALGTLNGIGQVLPDPKLLLRPLQGREAITSSNIEGTFVTAHELLLFEMNPSEPSKANDKKAEWQEVHNYSKSLEEGIKLLEEMPFCNRLIRKMHSALMHGVRGRDKMPGEFRKHQVQIGSSGKFIPPPSPEVEALMANLEQYVNNSESTYDPLIKSFIVHYQFETIHPFLDGNGRIGRAILALMIYKWLGHASPWLYMSAFFEKFKDEYMDSLYRVSAEGNWNRWISFCLRGATEQSRDSVNRCHQLNRLRKEFYSRVDSKTSRTYDLIDALFSSPVVQVASLKRRFGVTYPTAKADVQALVSVGILQEISDFKPRTFYSKEIMDIAYRDEAPLVAPTAPEPPSSPPDFVV
ncbi:MAG: Fic family protein [Gemmataceae bacterium]|nr:Fic family protein [Gemmataceae bacterium]